MNWITTNIRLPEDDYMELKLMAARRRTSVSALVREKLGVGVDKTDRKEFWERLDKFAGQIAKKHPNARLSERLVEMRYEQ